MNLVVMPADDADMPRLFEIASLAFQHNEPDWDAEYPHHESPRGRRIGGERFVNAKNTDPHALFLKAIDRSTAEIVGFAKWSFFLNRFPAPAKAEGDFWDLEDEKAYNQHLMTEFNRDRQAYLRSTNGNALCLDICVIDPRYQRMGIGGLLVKWGLNNADELGLDAVVESTFCGKGLYEKNGFVCQRHVTLQLPEQWETRLKSCYVWMVRPGNTKN